MEINEEVLKFKHPFTCMVAGPTSSGKTVLVRKIIKNYKKLITFPNGTPDRLKLIWAYGQRQDMHHIEIGENIDCNYIPGLPSETEVRHDMPHLIVIDDLMTELGDHKGLANLFTKGSHHLNISIIFISQNLFHQGKQMRSIGLNCHYYIIMKNPVIRIEF